MSPRPAQKVAKFTDQQVELLDQSGVGAEVRLGEIRCVPFSLAVKGAMGGSVECGVAEDGFTETAVERAHREREPEAALICASHPLTLTF